MEVASSDGVSVVVHDLGGDGSPFLICHATGFCALAYGPMAERLTDRHHVWAIDFRGHGDTVRPANSRFDWRAMADDLEAVIAALTDEPIAVFGHSMGGGVSMLVEHRRPGTLRCAYFYEPIILPAMADVPGGNKDVMVEAARRRRPAFASKADALMRYATRPPLNVLQAGALAAYVENGLADEPDGTARLKCRPEDEAATFGADGKPTLELAAQVQTRTTIAIGADDGGTWTPAMFGPAIVEAMPDAALERHPALGHFGPLQDPALIASAILDREC